MSHRLKFTVKKLIRMALLLLGVSLAAFALMTASPLDPLQTNIGQAALGSMSPEQIARLEDYWGVTTPPAERYWNWLRDALRGDLGASYTLWQEAQETIAGDVPWVWLVNVDHLYWVRDGLDVAEQKIHPHGHGWSIVNNEDAWEWQS